MNLAIDIGNSMAHLAVYDMNKIIYLRKLQSSSEFKRRVLLTVKKKFTGKIISAGISSVVKGEAKTWSSLIYELFSINPLIVSYGIKLPVKINIKFPEKIGPDRICNAVAAYEFYKRKENVIAADFGTAATYDVILKNGNYIGGIIAPGISTMAKSLHEYTSLLPQLKSSDLSLPRRVVGRNTIEAMRSGTVYASLASFEGIIKKIQSELDSKFRIILTGGYASLIHSSTKYKTAVNQNLVLDGINHIIGYNLGT